MIDSVRFFIGNYDIKCSEYWAIGIFLVELEGYVRIAYFRITAECCDR